MVKILAQRLSHISAVAMALLHFVVGNDDKKSLNKDNMAYTDKGREKEQKMSAWVSAFCQPHRGVSERSQRDR